MGPLSTVRPLLQPLGGAGGTQNQAEPAQALRPQQAASATVAQNGAKLEPAAASESPQALTAVQGTARSNTHIADKGHLVEAARHRAEAAQRAYAMTMLALGFNPLNDPAP